MSLHSLISSLRLTRSRELATLLTCRVVLMTWTEICLSRLLSRFRILIRRRRLFELMVSPCLILACRCWDVRVLRLLLLMVW